MKIYDLSHDVRTGMQIYPLDVEVEITEWMVHEKDYCHVDKMVLGSHSGTHIDAAYHFIAEGKRITDYPIEKFFGKGVIIDVRGKEENTAIELDEIKAYDEKITKGCFAIIMTGWSQYFNSEKYIRHPYLSKKSAEYLHSKGVSIVAIDALNVDSTVTEEWNAHPVFLKNDILIVENLNNIEALDVGKSYHYSFLPLKATGNDGSPIRAVAFDFAVDDL